MSFFNKIFGDPNDKVIKKIRKDVEKINELEEKYKKLSDQELQNKTKEFKKELESGKSLDDILFDAFATVREVSIRVTGMRHYDVQMIGGIVLHRGQIAEMRTGEGKTLTSTLPIYLNALSGKGVHVITVNDYLAARDAVWMAQIFDYLGLSISCIQTQNQSFMYDKTVVADEATKDAKRDEMGSFKIVHDYLRPCTRKEAYEADITYGTNNEFGFDYLRDNMAHSEKELSQRELSYAIIDEVDSILIDEARTPLIISAAAEESGALYQQFAQLVKGLEENKHYNVDEKMRAATLTDDGVQLIEKKLGIDNLYQEGGLAMVHHLEQALKAEVLFQKDKDYVVQEDEIVIVDEFTGRMMPGRRFSEGLHQAIEAKESVEIKRESKTLATITFQNYFRLYDKLAGMTGTAATEAEEFSKIYELEVVIIPTNRPIARKDLSDKIYKNEHGKFKAVVEDVKKRYKEGQPVLIGTTSIDKSELVGKLLDKAHIPHQVLNAKNHEKEAEIIAQAGRKNAVTVATNMAGRGVDIVLGGMPKDENVQKEVLELGGLHVIGTERHESRRIDNQLRGRSGRQGDNGSSQFYLSMDDDVMRIFGSERMKKVMETLGVPDDMPIENTIISRSIESAQRKVEGNNFDIRKHVLEYDDVLNKHRDSIYTQRREILTSDDARQRIIKMIENEIEQVVSFHTAGENPHEWNVKEIIEVTQTIYPLVEELKKRIQTYVEEHMTKKSLHDLRSDFIELLIAQAKNYYQESVQTVVDVVGNDDIIKPMEKGLLLRTFDMLWVDHLDAMHQMRISIGLRGYGQRDPLIEYKKEAFRMYNELQNLIQKQVVYSIFKLDFGGNVIKKPTQNLNDNQNKKGGGFVLGMNQ